MIFFGFSTSLRKNRVNIATISEILLNFASVNLYARRSFRDFEKAGGMFICLALMLKEGNSWQLFGNP